jgi:hypothetical protein
MSNPKGSAVTIAEVNISGNDSPPLYAMTIYQSIAQKFIVAISNSKRVAESLPL